MIDFNNLDWLFKAAQQNSPSAVSDGMGLLNSHAMAGLMGPAGLLGGARTPQPQGAQINANEIAQNQQAAGLLSQRPLPMQRQQSIAQPAFDYGFLNRITGGL